MNSFVNFVSEIIIFQSFAEKPLQLLGNGRGLLRAPALLGPGTSAKGL